MFLDGIPFDPPLAGITPKTLNLFTVLYFLKNLNQCNCKAS
jgi:hypothetical protein